MVNGEENVWCNFREFKFDSNIIAKELIDSDFLQNIQSPHQQYFLLRVLARCFTAFYRTRQKTVYPSIGLMYIISLIPFKIPFYLEWFSPFLIYTILYHLFDKKLWKLRIVNRLIKTTNLNGKYNGILKSNRDDFSKEHFVNLEIIQNWTTICIHLTTNLSNSFSIIAALSVIEGIGINLFYYFHSSPNATAPPDMHSHYGFAEILFKKDSFENAESNYFTGRDREYYGSVVYKKL